MYKWEKYLIRAWFSSVDRTKSFYEYFKTHYILTGLILLIAYLLSVGVLIWHN